MRLKNSLLAMLVAATPVVLHAANPHIGVDRDPPDPIIVTSNSFSFGANQFGGGDISFLNESGKDWFEMTFNATLPTLTPITCTPGPFLSCTVATTPVTAGFLYTILFGPVSQVGIPNNTGFSINLNDDGSLDPNGVGSWGAGEDFSVKTNVGVAPEPAAYLLMGAGLLGLGAFYALRRRAAVC